MEEQIYFMKDRTGTQEDNCSFFVKSNCPSKVFDEIVKTAHIVYFMDEGDDFGEEANKYFKQRYGGLNEIIEYIVRDKGYTWETTDVVTVEW